MISNDGISQPFNRNLNLKDTEFKLDLKKKPDAQGQNSLDKALQFLNSQMTSQPVNSAEQQRERLLQKMQKSKENQQSVFTNSNVFQKREEPNQEQIIEQQQQKMQEDNQVIKKQQGQYKYELNEYLLKPKSEPKNQQQQPNLQTIVKSPQLQQPQNKANEQEIDTILSLLQKKKTTNEAQKEQDLMSASKILLKSNVSEQSMPKLQQSQLSLKSSIADERQKEDLVAEAEKLLQQKQQKVQQSQKDTSMNLSELSQNQIQNQTVQNLSQMLASQQKEILQTINEQSTGIEVYKDQRGDLTVKLQKLEPKQDRFESKQLKTIYFRIKETEIPKNSTMKTRKSDEVESWKQRRQDAELKKAENMRMLLAKQHCPTRRTFIWFNRQVGSIVVQRAQYLHNEVTMFNQQSQKDLFKTVKYLNQFETVSKAGLSLLEGNKAKITNQQIIPVLANYNLIKSVQQQVVGELQRPQLKLQTLNSFITKIFMKQNLGSCQRAETYIAELADCMQRFGKISSSARFLALFFREEVVNYVVYQGICGFKQDENEFCKDSFEVYRLNQYITEGEFVQIRNREDEIMGAILLLFEQIDKIKQQRRSHVPDYLVQQVQQELGQGSQMVWQNSSADANQVPHYVSADVLQFPKHKALLGNIVATLFNDFAVQLKLLIPKEQYPQFLSASFVTGELSGFNIWSQVDGEYEAEVWCVMEALVRVFNAVFEEAQKFIRRVAQK